MRDCVQERRGSGEVIRRQWDNVWRHHHCAQGKGGVIGASEIRSPSKRIKADISQKRKTLPFSHRCLPWTKASRETTDTGTWDRQHAEASLLALLSMARGQQARDVSTHEWESQKLVKTGGAIEHSILSKVKAQVLEQLKRALQSKVGYFKTSLALLELLSSSLWFITFFIFILGHRRASRWGNFFIPCSNMKSLQV